MELQEMLEIFIPSLAILLLNIFYLHYNQMKQKKDTFIKNVIDNYFYIILQNFIDMLKEVESGRQNKTILKNVQLSGKSDTSLKAQYRRFIILCGNYFECETNEIAFLEIIDNKVVNVKSKELKAIEKKFKNKKIKLFNDNLEIR